MDAVGPFPAEHIVKGCPPSVIGGGHDKDREQRQESGITVGEDPHGISRPGLRPELLLRFSHRPRHQHTRSRIIQQCQEQQRNQEHWGKDCPRKGILALGHHEQECLSIRRVRGYAHALSVVFDITLKAVAWLVILKEVLCLLTDHFRIGVGDKASVRVADGRGNIAFPNDLAADRVFIAYFLQLRVQLPGAVYSQKESLRLARAVCHQDRRAKLHRARIGIRFRPHDSIGITQHHRLILLAEVCFHGKARIAVAGNDLIPGAVKEHQIIGSRHTAEFRKAFTGPVIRMLRQEVRQHLRTCPVNIRKVALNLVLLFLPPGDLRFKLHPLGLGGEGHICPAFQQQKHIGKEEGDRKHHQDALPCCPDRPLAGEFVRVFFRLVPQKPAENVDLKQHDSQSDDGRNGRGDINAVFDHIFQRVRQQDIRIFLCFLRIMHQYRQVTPAQQGDELAGASLSCAPEAAAVIEYLLQFFMEPRQFFVRKVVRRILLQLIAGFGIGGGVSPGDQAIKHVRPVVQGVVHLQQRAAGEFKDQAALRVSRHGKPNKEFAVIFSRLRPAFRKRGVEFPMGLARLKALNAGIENLLRTHGAGGGKQFSLSVQQRNAVGGTRGAHPFQLFRVPKRVLFLVQLQPEFRAGQSVVFVNAAAHRQIIPVAVDDFR